MAAIEALSSHPNGIAQHALILRLNGKPGTAILLHMLPEPPLPRMENLIRSKLPREETGNGSFDLKINPARQSSGVCSHIKFQPMPMHSSHLPDFSSSFHLT
jgi:hypothetical protein